MTSRERVKQVLNHKQADKVVFDLGGTCCSTAHVSVVEGLREYYGLEKRPIKVYDVFTMVGMFDEDLMDAMGADLVPSLPIGMSFGLRRENWKEWKNLQGQTILVPDAFNPESDGQGGYYVRPYGDKKYGYSGHMPAKSFYFDAVLRQEDYDEDEIRPTDNLVEFGLLNEDDLAFIKAQAEEGVRQGRAVVYGAPGMGLGDAADIPGVGLKNPHGIRNYTDWYTAALVMEEYVQEMFDRQMDIALENLRRVNDTCGDLIDVAFTCAADLSHQHSLFVSPETFDACYMAPYKKVNDWIHKNTDWKVLKHNCGAVEPLIPQLIEAGFDALNPVQTTADGMDPVILKEKYGKDITFWGGGIETQTILPFGTPEEVRAQTLERCEIFGKDGGFVFNAIHDIQANTPIKNVVAMIDAVKEFNGDK